MDLQLKPSQQRMLNHIKTLDDDVDIIQFINRRMPIGSGKTKVLTKYIQELKGNKKQSQGLCMQQYGRSYRPVMKFAKEKKKTMTVNLKGLKVGYIVTFRNGYSLPVTSIRDGKHRDVVIGLMNMNNMNDVWNCDGTSPGINRERDIVSVKKLAFDWDTAENGMAFKGAPTTVWYIGKDISSDTHVIVSTDIDKVITSDVKVACKSDLTRAPKHDIKG